MQSEQSLTSNSNVDSIRHEDANPFSYRSALQALLGMSNVEGRQVSYARMVPSVQLWDIPQPLTGQPAPLPEAVQETGLSFDDAVVPNSDSPASSPGASTPYHGLLEQKAMAPLRVPPQPRPMPAAHTARTLEESSTAQPRASARYANLVVAHRASPIEASIQHTLRQRNTDTTSEHDRGSGAAIAKVEQPDKVLEEIAITVPGTSKRSQHFPALAPAKHNDRPVSTAEESEDAAKERGHHRGLRTTQPPERGGLSAVERKPASESHLMADSAEVAVGRLGALSDPVPMETSPPASSSCGVRSTIWPQRWLPDRPGRQTKPNPSRPYRRSRKRRHGSSSSNRLRRGLDHHGRFGNGVI